MIFYDDFREMVNAAVSWHISRDTSLVQADLDWEVDQLTNTLRQSLIYRGVNIGARQEPPRQDLSKFEGV